MKAKTEILREKMAEELSRLEKKEFDIQQRIKQQEINIQMLNNVINVNKTK